MGLTSSYLVAVSRWGEFLNAIRGAQAPEKFSLTFLKDLGFTSSNERLFIPVLKAIGFLDESGAPTERYFAFLDDSRWQLVLADGVREAYSDLFQLNRNAQQMEKGELIGKLKSLTRGQYSEPVIENMARTFQTLCSLANFSQELPPPKVENHEDESELDEGDDLEEANTAPPGDRAPRRRAELEHSPPLLGQLTYRIELVLPPTRDKAIYDALFRSLREHFG